MKKILDTIADWGLFISAITIVLFVSYLVGVNVLILIVAIHVAPVIIFALNRDGYISSFTLKNATNFHSVCAIVAILLGMALFYTNSKITTYLDKKMINGKIKKDIITGQDDDGHESSDTFYYFVAEKKSDNYKIEIIEWWICILSFGCPIYMYYGSKRILNKVEAIERDKKLWRQNENKP